MEEESCVYSGRGRAHRWQLGRLATISGCGKVGDRPLALR